MWQASLVPLEKGAPVVRVPHVMDYLELLAPLVRP